MLVTSDRAGGVTLGGARWVVMTIAGGIVAFTMPLTEQLGKLVSEPAARFASSDVREPIFSRFSRKLHDETSSHWSRRVPTGTTRRPASASWL